MNHIKEFFIKRGYNVNDGYKGTSYYIEVLYENGSVIRNYLTLKNRIFYIDIETNFHFKSNDEVDKSLFDYFFAWEKIIQEREPFVVLLPDSVRNLFSSYTKSASTLSTFSFFEMTQQQREIAAWLDQSFKGYYWLRLNGPSLVEFYCNLFATVFEFLHDSQIKDKTMTYDLNKYQSGLFPFYYQGAHSIIELQSKGWICELKCEDKIYEIQTEEEMKESLQDVLSRVYKKQRTKNIFNPPKKHFKEFCSYLLRIKKEEVIDRFHHHLLTSGLSYQEIELYSVEQNRSKDFKRVASFDQHLLFEFSNFIILYRQENDVFETFPKENIDHAKNNFKNYIIEKKIKEIEKSLSDF